MDSPITFGIDDATSVAVTGIEKHLRFIPLSTASLSLNADELCGVISQQPGFLSEIQEKFPWLPVLKTLTLDENTAIRVGALHELLQLYRSGLSRGALVAFHSRYKVLLLAHSQPLYRDLGRFVATLNICCDLQAFFYDYRQRLMLLLSQPATRRNHTNALMHVQGYFRPHLSESQKRDLTQCIEAYRCAEVERDAPMALLMDYLTLFPNDYLAQQRYFQPLPPTLKKLLES